MLECDLDCYGNLYHIAILPLRPSPSSLPPLPPVTTTTTTIQVIWSLDKVTTTNTLFAVPMLYIVYDFFYTLFHRALHHRSIYKYVHKHHHKQVSGQQQL